MKHTERNDLLFYLRLLAIKVQDFMVVMIENGTGIKQLT